MVHIISLKRSKWWWYRERKILELFKLTYWDLESFGDCIAAFEHFGHLFWVVKKHRLVDLDLYCNYTMCYKDYDNHEMCEGIETRHRRSVWRRSWRSAALKRACNRFGRKKHLGFSFFSRGKLNGEKIEPDFSNISKLHIQQFNLEAVQLFRFGLLLCRRPWWLTIESFLSKDVLNSNLSSEREYENGMRNSILYKL